MNGIIKMQIVSPVATGNGAYIVHKTLERLIRGYRVKAYNPYWSLFPCVLPFFADCKADLIHATADYGCWFKRSNIPLIVTLHNFVLDPYMQPYSSYLQNLHYQSDLKLFSKKSLLKADKITSVSQFTADIAKDYLQLDVDIEVISNGIDSGHFYPKKLNISSKIIKVLFCGNLTLRKGVQWLPEIAQGLNQNIDILYTGGLNKTGRHFDIPQLQAIGAVPYKEMADLYNRVDMLLMPTVREGMSLAVLEAMACGLPVIASNCSSMPELIDHGKGGYLCEIGNVIDFANYINILSEDGTLRREMGQYNRAKIEKNYTLQKMIDSYRNVFEAVV